MSSPSRSKSVAMMRLVASTASFLTVRTTDLAVSVLTSGASMSSRGSTLRHSENSGGKSTWTTWPLSPTATDGSPSTSSKM